MPIAAQCPSCNAQFQAPDALAGKQAKCPSCNQIFVVGGAAPQPQAQPAGAPAQAAPQQPATPAPTDNLNERLERRRRDEKTAATLKRFRLQLAVFITVGVTLTFASCWLFFLSFYHVGSIGTGMFVKGGHVRNWTWAVSSENQYKVLLPASAEASDGGRLGYEGGNFNSVKLSSGAEFMAMAVPIDGEEVLEAILLSTTEKTRYPGLVSGKEDIYYVDRALTTIFFYYAREVWGVDRFEEKIDGEMVEVRQPFAYRCYIGDDYLYALFWRGPIDTAHTRDAKKFLKSFRVL